MAPHVLLAQLRSLLARAPDFRNRGQATEQIAWLAQGHALITRWDKYEAMSFKLSSDFLIGDLNREVNIAQVLGALHRAAADLELQAAAASGQAFGSGAVYDFFKALRELVASAGKSLVIVDPYMDAQIFDEYLSSVSPGVSIQLLVANSSADLKAAAARFASQHKAKLEVRSSKQLHDRIIFVDEDVCWVVGQSIKDAAVKKATYLAPLSSDVAASKLAIYKAVWQSGSAILAGADA
jgi:hypothetical protein